MNCSLESQEIQDCWNRIEVLQKKLQIAYHTLALIAWLLASNALEEMDSIGK
jgi:hypothetical protein